jgi:hypothetical protein
MMITHLAAFALAFMAFPASAESETVVAFYQKECGVPFSDFYNARLSDLGGCNKCIDMTFLHLRFYTKSFSVSSIGGQNTCNVYPNGNCAQVPVTTSSDCKLTNIPTDKNGVQSAAMSLYCPC